MNKSNADLNFFLVSNSIYDLEDLYKNFFLQHSNSTNDYLEYSQELVDFFKTSRIYFDKIGSRLKNLPPTKDDNNSLLLAVQNEAIDWFKRLLALNIVFLSDWITKTKLELEQLTQSAKKHSLSEESKESAIGKFLLVSLEEQKKYFLGVQEQLQVFIK